MVNQLIKISIFLFSIIIIQSCNSKKSENFMLLNGKIDGLRKGTLYLQKFALVEPPAHPFGEKC